MCMRQNSLRNIIHGRSFFFHFLKNSVAPLRWVGVGLGNIKFLRGRRDWAGIRQKRKCVDYRT